MSNDTVHDLVLGGLDQVMPLLKTQESLLERVDQIIQNSVEQGNPDIAGDALNYLLGVSRLSGLALAKTIYTFKFQWEKFNRREAFESYMDDHCGVKKVTVKRYYNVWDMLVSGDVPREYAEKLKLLPIGCLVPIATTWTQGYEIESQHWLKLSNAPDPATVRKIIREDIKKVEIKPNALQLNLEEDGTIYAWCNNKRYFVGHLNVDDEDEIVQKAIERLIGDGRVLEK